MADGAGMAGAPLDVSGRKPGAAGGIHAVDLDAAVVVDAVHAAQGVRVVDSSGLNHILPVEAGQTLAQTIWLSGELSPPALCSGLGRCGACRVRFFEGTPKPCDADSAILGAEAVRGGWRLACRHAAVAGMVVELPPPPSEKRKRMDIRPDAGPFRLAVDLGTTSIHWRLLDGTGHEAASGQALNPQMGAGSDVVSRLAAARNQEGRERLGHLVLRFLQRVVSDVGVPVAELCIAGNTAMTSILLNEDVAGLCAAPYRLTEPGDRTAELPGLPPAWIPPQPAPFVGGDISAGMAALLYGESPEFPFLLADMGTNGEFVLALDKERSFIVSVPLGPSLEGIGLRYGGVADTGSVSGFRLGPFGLSPVVIGNTEPKRICGTGYLSLLDALLRTGFLDATGRLASASVSPLAARLLGTVERGAAGWSLPLPGGMERRGRRGGNPQGQGRVFAGFGKPAGGVRAGEQGARAGLPRRCARGTHAGNRTGAAGLSAAGPTGAHCGGGQHLPARGGASADAPGTAGEAGPLEFRVYACGSGGPSRFYGPVHAAYGFRISAVRLQEAAFCGIASVFDTL